MPECNEIRRWIGAALWSSRAVEGGKTLSDCRPLLSRALASTTCCRGEVPAV